MDFEALNNKFCESDLRANNLIQNICLPETARQDMEKALESLSGPFERTVRRGDKEAKILIDLPTFLRNPLQDIKEYGPDSYDEFGNAVYTIEPNLNGLFPNGDLLETLEALEKDESTDLETSQEEVEDEFLEDTQELESYSRKDEENLDQDLQENEEILE